MFIDTHCHLYSEYYDDLEQVKKRSFANGITKVINNGCDQKTNEEILKLIAKNEYMYGAIGIHPENVYEYSQKDLDFIEKNINNKKIVAIGEIGLDYHYEKTSKEEQKKLFEYQLALAEKYKMPVVIHSREATQDTIDILKKYNVNGVIHSFSGSLEVAKIYIKMGYLLGVNGVITFKNANIKDVYKEIPLENIILETDSPYLTPHPYRGKKNEPMYIKTIAEFVANVKNVSLEDLAKQTNQNVQKMFNMDINK